MSTRRMVTRVMMVTGAIVLTGVLARAQQGAPMAGHDMAMPKGAAMPQSMTMMTAAQKIANAIEAGPSSVTAKATILDWPAKEGAAPAVLRKGTNAWTCFPDMPETKGNDPMCVDAMWMKWVDAYLAHTPPMITGVGIGYMMASGGAWGSNTDPYAMAQTKDNQWGHHMPHLMILVPDVKALAGMPTDPANGGPYVMFAGTPYAHIMAPTAAGAMMPMGK